MDYKQIIQAETARAEALIGKYLGFYAGDLELAELNVMAIDDVSDDFKRCVQLIQDISGSAASHQTARNMINLVDSLADLVQVPRLRQPLMRMWEIEESLSSGGFSFVRHAFVIFLGFVGVLSVGEDMGTQQMVLTYAAGFVAFLSLALGLTHFKNPVSAFFIGIPVALVGCAAVQLIAGETLMMFALMCVSIGLLVKDVFEMVTRPSAAVVDRSLDDDFPTIKSLDFEDEANPYLHNHANVHPYAADD